MATIKELIRTEAAGGISFGNYELNISRKIIEILNIMEIYIK